MMDSELAALYRDVIIDHNKSPRNFGELDPPRREADGYNPLCGDRLTVYVTLDDGRIDDVSFQGSGCAISIASASLMTEALKGKTVLEARDLFERMHTLLTERDSASDDEALGKLAALEGVRAYPSRVKCATLAWHTLQSALRRRAPIRYHGVNFMYGGVKQVVTAERDCPGVLVPAGTEVVIPEGTEVQVTQAMGGSVTVYIGGNLVRVDAGDADALGLDVDRGESMPENPCDEEFKELAWAQLKTCFDPEIPINIVDLGLIYKCEVTTREDGKRDVAVDLSLTAPGCGMGDILLDDVRAKLALIPSCGEITAELVFDPPWGPEMMSDEAKLQTGMY